MTSLAWKLRRLGKMGAAEVGYRALQMLRARLEVLGIGAAVKVPPAKDDARAGVAWLSAEAIPSAAPYQRAAEAILAGRFHVLALAPADLGFPPEWNRDPRTGHRAPLELGTTLDYRDASKVGDIKYLWEPNRHLELVTLAQAWTLTGDLRCAEGCRTLIESWLDQCPYPFGPNWASALELGVRLTNWASAWQLLGGDGSPLFTDASGAAFRQRWQDAVFRHCHFIAHHLSRYSSANNHLLGEYMGLFVGSVTWPLWPESSSWRALAREGLESEASRQNASDGVNREQAIWYHHEVADMLLVCSLIGRSSGIAFSDTYWQRLRAMLDFVAGLMDRAGNVPMIGDADDAVMLRLCPMPTFSVYRSLLATGAALFARSDFKSKAGEFDDKSRWLTGAEGEKTYLSLPVTSAADSPGRAFPQGGYWVLGDDSAPGGEVRVVVDSGPLGYLSIAAHGHADALAVWLSLGGQEMLVDPGTFTYQMDKEWRDYFRGTAAHNTVRIDGLDQSVSGGAFLWTRHARARCVACETAPDCDRWVGEHDGYTRLKDPVTHRREIVLDKGFARLMVRDTLACSGAHSVERHWHFAEDATVELLGTEIVASKGGVTMRLGSRGTASMGIDLVRGRERPPLGWVSRRFGVKIPSGTAVITDRIAGATVLETEIIWRLAPC